MDYYINKLWNQAGPKVTYFDDQGPYSVIEEQDSSLNFPFPVLVEINLKTDEVISIHSLNYISAI